jgi:FixJ family two-component response regulator
LNKKTEHLNVPLICVVDDDRSVVDAMVSLIQSVGYKAKGFRSAEEFLKSPQLLKTSCLILDVRMPSMGGLELQRHLAAGNCRFPIIFLTSYDSEEVRIQASQAGAVGFLAKPCSQEALWKTVRDALAGQGEVQPEG